MSDMRDPAEPRKPVVTHDRVGKCLRCEKPLHKKGGAVLCQQCRLANKRAMAKRVIELRIQGKVMGL